MKTRITTFLTTLIVLLFGILCGAQTKPGFLPPSIDDEEIPVVKTELPVPEEGKDYVVQYFKGVTDGVESRIAVKKLGYIIRPAMVQVISEDGRELAIELVKKNWDDVVRSGKTKDGKFQNSFKTAMEFGIKISAKEMGIPFVVAVSAGIELFPASNLFVDASTMRAGDGNKEMSTTDETDLMGEESRESNSILFIIIAIALVGILALLAVLVFKKKGKGLVTLLLLITVLPLNAGLVPTDLEFLAGLGKNIANSIGKHYGNGGYGGDDPLNEDDKNHQPEPDPRGQPSLPSSCYEITRMGRSGGLRGSGSGMDGLDGAKNPDNAEGGPTLTLGGGMAGGTSGGESGGDEGHEDGKDNDADLSVEQQVENATKGLERDRQETLNSFDIGLRRQMENYESVLRGTRETYQQQKTQAEGDPERQSSLADAFVAREKELGEMNAQRVEELKTIRDNNLEQALQYYNNRILEIMRQASERDGAQQNNDAGEKDPDRDPKKDPDREQGKGADSGDSSKGVGSSNDDEEEGSNSSNSSTGTNDSNGEGRRENEAGCQCLEAAYADLLKRRQSLEKLLKIGQHTKKVTDFGISFGDDFSSIHGVSGLVWQTQRAKVLESIKSFDVTYDNKYKELLDKLYNALIKIDECENKLGYENWYSQSGFIYYEFMKVRYAHYK